MSGSIPSNSSHFNRHSEIKREKSEDGDSKNLSSSVSEEQKKKIESAVENSLKRDKLSTEKREPNKVPSVRFSASEGGERGRNRTKKVAEGRINPQSHVSKKEKPEQIQSFSRKQGGKREGQFTLTGRMREHSPELCEKWEALEQLKEALGKRLRNAVKLKGPKESEKSFEQSNPVYTQKARKLQSDSVVAELKTKFDQANKEQESVQQALEIKGLERSLGEVKGDIGKAREELRKRAGRLEKQLGRLDPNKSKKEAEKHKKILEKLEGVVRQQNLLQRGSLSEGNLPQVVQSQAGPLMRGSRIGAKELRKALSYDLQRADKQKTSLVSQLKIEEVSEAFYDSGDASLLRNLEKGVVPAVLMNVAQRCFNEGRAERIQGASNEMYVLRNAKGLPLGVFKAQPENIQRSAESVRLGCPDMLRSELRAYKILELYLPDANVSKVAEVELAIPAAEEGEERRCSGICMTYLESAGDMGQALEQGAAKRVVDRLISKNGQEKYSFSRKNKVLEKLGEVFPPGTEPLSEAQQDAIYRCCAELLGEICPERQEEYSKELDDERGAFLYGSWEEVSSGTSLELLREYIVDQNNRSSIEPKPLDRAVGAISLSDVENYYVTTETGANAYRVTPHLKEFFEQLHPRDLIEAMVIGALTGNQDPNVGGILLDWDEKEREYRMKCLDFDLTLPDSWQAANPSCLLGASIGNVPIRDCPYQDLVDILRHRSVEQEKIFDEINGFAPRELSEEERKEGLGGETYVIAEAHDRLWKFAIDQGKTFNQVLAFLSIPESQFINELNFFTKGKVKGEKYDITFLRLRDTPSSLMEIVYADAKSSVLKQLKIKEGDKRFQKKVWASFDALLPYYFSLVPEIQKEFGSFF